MVYGWCFGFLIGSLFNGIQGWILEINLTYLIVFQSLFTPFLANKRKLFKGVLIFFGFLWGMSNNGTSPKELNATGIIAKSQPFVLSDKEFVVIKTENIQIASQSKYSKGTKGNIKCLSFRCKFSPSNAYFNHIIPQLEFIQKLKIAFQKKVGHSLRGFKNRKIRSFIKGILFADPNGIPIQIKEQFKSLGIYHLLITSGIHITILFLFFSLLLLIPFQLLYVVRLINPNTWVYLFGFLSLLSIFFLTVYGMASGLSLPIKRCLISILFSLLISLFYSKIPKTDLISFSFLVNTLLFPIGLLSKGSILSWGSFIFLALSLKEEATLTKNLKHFLEIQVLLVLLLFLVLGNFTPASFVSNYFIGIIFSPLLLLTFLIVMTNCIFNFAWGMNWIEILMKYFINFVGYISSWNPVEPVYLAMDDKSTWNTMNIISVLFIIFYYWYQKTKITNSSKNFPSAHY